MLKVQSLTVRSDRLVCIVCVDPPTPRTSSPDLMRALTARFPDLPRHACVNEAGPTFAHVMDRTSLPHVLEHLIIDLQLAALASRGATASADRMLTGATQWVNLKKGTARIEVSYWDDLVALKCVTRAVDELNQVCEGLAK